MEQKEAFIQKQLEKCELESTNPGFEQRMKSFYEHTKHMRPVSQEEFDSSDLDED